MKIYLQGTLCYLYATVEHVKYSSSVGALGQQQPLCMVT